MTTQWVPTAVLLGSLSFVVLCSTGQAANLELVPKVTETNGVRIIDYSSGDMLAGRGTSTAPAGVQLRFPGTDAEPILFRAHSQADNKIELGPTKVRTLTVRLLIAQKTPALIERVLEVTADTAQRVAISFPIDMALDGEFASFSGPVKARTLFDTVRGSPNVETFPVAMLRTTNLVFGIAADSPGLWENRCQVLLDPAAGRLGVLAGDGRDPYPLIVKPPEDARDTYQYQMDGWQSLAAGETRRFVTWVFASPARTHYDAQVAAHLAVANGKGWNSSLVEAILRNTSLFLLRRNLALDANQQPRDGRFIFISGPGYGWKQWVSDGFYTALGLDDPEKTIEANRAVFWNRMDYEDNAQYYLIWAVLMKRAGGTFNQALVRQAYDFLRRNEKDGLFIPPPLPGAPNAKGWKTYHDVLPYDDDDSPASNQGFHCGALLSAQELELPVTTQNIDRAIAAYRSLFNIERGFMPTSRKQRDILGQDTLYGATLTYAVFGRKLLLDEQVLTHIRTSEKVKTPYGLRVISQADGSLLPGHSGVYCYGGSWFLNDAANYLLANVHGLPAAEVDALLVERIGREIAHVPAFNESISTLNGQPHGHVLYSWNSGYWWLRREIRKRLGQTGPDPVDAAIDRRLGVIRENGSLELDPERLSSPPKTKWPDRLIGYTELRTDLPGGRQANVRTMRAMLMKPDGSGQQPVAAELADGPDTWTQFAGWSPDGKLAVIYRAWESPENAAWEEEHKTFRFTSEGWRLDSYLVDLASGKTENLTAVDRVSFYNSGLFFWPNDPTRLGFTALVDGQSHPFRMNRDGRNKSDLTKNSKEFTYGFSSSPDGKRISYHKDYQVFLANADGSGAAQVQTGHPFNFGPTWSPDGQWVLFLSGEHYDCHPHIVRAGGSGLRKLADRGGYRGVVEFFDVPDFHGGSSDTPVWSSDGRRVFYTSKFGPSVELFQVTLDGVSEQLTHSPPGTLHYHSQPSPDGQWLLYGAKRAGVRQLFLLRLSDRAERQLTSLKSGHAAMWPYWQLAAGTEHKVISRGQAAGTYQAFPDVCRLQDGELLCVFYGGYGHISLPKEGCPRGGRVCMVRSSDEGRTWSSPEALYDGPSDDRDPHIAQMRDGTMVCSFFTYRPQADGKVQCDTCCVTSRDGGHTWDTQARVLAAGWPSSAPVREMPDGTRMLGVYQEEAGTAYGGVIRSTDAGKTWSAPVPIGKGSGIRLDAETDFVLLKDGLLYAALRGDRVNMHYATSQDEGLTWSAVKDIGFPAHCPHFTRLTTGEILLAHRLPQTALHVSRDEGKTWQGPYPIDRNIGAYPSTVELQDHTVLVVYYEEGEGSAIRARRFRLKSDGPEFLAWQ